MSSAPTPTREPSGSVNPPTTNSCRFTHLIFCQSGDRESMRYGPSRSLLMIPSAPSAQALAKTSAPSASTCSVYRITPARVPRSFLRSPLALLERQFGEILAVERQQVEHEIREALALRADLLEQLKVRQALVVEHNDLAVEDRLLCLQLFRRGHDLGKVGSCIRCRAGR